MHIRKDIFLLIVMFFFTSCKTDLIVRPLYKSAHVSEIEKLPAINRIQEQEMKDWSQMHMSATSLIPDWDNRMQTLNKGREVDEVRCGNGTALFFTKVNGLLNVYAAIWEDKNPGSYFFTGNIMYYSFQEKTLTGAKYDKYGALVKIKTIKIPTPIEGPTAETAEGRVIAIMLSPAIWRMAGLK